VAGCHKEMILLLSEDIKLVFLFASSEIHYFGHHGSPKLWFVIFGSGMALHEDIVLVIAIHLYFFFNSSSLADSLEVKDGSNCY
jgi:hypothetical protein